MTRFAGHRYSLRMACTPPSTRYRALSCVALLCLSVFACEDGILVGARLPPGAQAGASGTPYEPRAGSGGQTATAGGSIPGAGGSSAGRAQGGASDASGGDADPGGEAGAAGAAGFGVAGAPPVFSGPWQWLEAPPPAHLPPGALPDEERTSSTRIVGATPDGHVLIGESFTSFPRFANDPLGLEARAFVWRKESGLRGLGELPFVTEYPLTRIRPFAISSDGARISGDYEVAVPGKLADDTSGKNWHSAFAGLFQWSEKGGYERIELTDIPLPQDQAPGFYPSDDAQVAWGGYGQKLFIWSAADGFRWFEPFPNWQPAVGRSISASRDGSSLLGTASDSPYEIETFRLFRWRSNGLVWLGSLPGFPYCDARLISPDGSVIVGSCMSVVSPNAVYRTFRWSEATGMIAVAPNSELQLDPIQMTPDGNGVVGRTFLGSQSLEQLGAWTPTSGVTLVHGLTSTPSYYEFQRYTRDYRDSILSAEGSGYQWTAANGLREFEPLAPGGTSWLKGQSLDASLFFGSSGVKSGGGGVSGLRSVIWDAHGVRDLVVELEALNVELEGYELGLQDSVLGITSEDDQVVTFGNATKPGVGPARAWVARVPLRH